MTARRVTLMGAALLLGGCSSGDQSIALIFPNQEAIQATVRVVVEAHTPDTGAASANDRDCGDFLGKARQGKPPLGTPVRGDYDYPFTAAQELPKVPSGPQIIYVLAYATREDDAPIILEGCSDRFDSTGGSDDHVDVPIELELVIPENARLVKVAGDRQVGREGQTLAVPLRVRVEADPPTGTGTYVIPGVDVVFETRDPSFILPGGEGGVRRTVTDVRGEATADVQLPGVAKTGEIDAIAEQLDAEGGGDTSRFKQTFSLSVTELATFPSSTVIEGSDTPIALALGRIGQGGGLDLAVLSCVGAEDGCRPGVEARGPLGRTKLTVLADVGTTPTALTVVEPARGLGITPAALVVADLVGGGATGDEIALLNSRRAECQDRTCTAASCSCWGVPIGGACPCEGSEVLVLEASGGSVVLDHRATLTASNAVGMTAYVADNASFKNLAIAAQGRSKNTQPCSRVNRCLPNAPMCADSPESCGCPPGERCECPECTASNEPGVCVARDKIIDLLVNRWNDTASQLACSPVQPRGSCPAGQVCEDGRCVATTLFNRGGCQEPTVSCSNGTASGECSCGDEFRQNDCGGTDACGCPIPERIVIGADDSPYLPNGLVAGPLEAAENWDIVMPLDRGLGLVEARPSQKTFGFKDLPIINARMDGMVVAQLDAEVDDVPDVVWTARGTCTRGVNFDRACPLFRVEEEGEEPRGCLGVYYTDGQDSVFELRTPQEGGCRRYLLPYSPDGLCSGLLNDDDFVDVAVSSRDTNFIAVFNGDGRGGLLDPPEHIPLPGGGTGGPLTCGDVDGDGRDDLVVVSRSGGEIYVLRSGS